MPDWESSPERGAASISRQEGCMLEGHLIGFFAVYGGIKRSEPAVLRAESPGCDNLGLRAARSTPGCHIPGFQPEAPLARCV